MNLSTRLTDIARSPGDPKIQETGASSLSASDRLARGLGWFSLALGAVELMAPGYITRTLGLNGKEALVRAYGARELAAAVPTLSVDSQVGLASRIAGDVMDIATLLPALRTRQPAARQGIGGGGCRWRGNRARLHRLRRREARP